MLATFYRMCATMLPIALEGLPVSSSGHVLLIIALIDRLKPALQLPVLPEQLDHLVHLPIAFIVAIFFFPRWLYLVMHITRLWKQFFKVMYLGCITVAVTGLLYVLVHTLGYNWFPLWLGYACTTALLFSLRRCKHEPYEGEWSVRTAVLLGAAQGLALLPGISRLGITYVTARWTGMRPQKAFELSFLIEWPISVAGFLKGLYDMRKSGGLDLITSFDIFTMMCATVIGLCGLWVMYYLVRTDRVWYIGWYTACLTFIALLAQVA